MLTLTRAFIWGKEIQHRMENEKKPYYGITYFNYEENFEAFHQVQTTSYF